MSHKINIKKNCSRLSHSSVHIGNDRNKHRMKAMKGKPYLILEIAQIWYTRERIWNQKWVWAKKEGWKRKCASIGFHGSGVELLTSHLEFFHIFLFSVPPPTISALLDIFFSASYTQVCHFILGRHTQIGILILMRTFHWSNN